MAPTIPVSMAPIGPVPTLDELVAAELTASELATVRAYSVFCGGSLLTWAAKLRRGAL